MENKCFFGWSRRGKHTHIPYLLGYELVGDIVEVRFRHSDKAEADLAEIFQTTHKDAMVWIAFVPEKLGELAYSYRGFPISVSVFDQDKTMTLRLKVTRATVSHSWTEPKKKLRREAKRFLKDRK